VVKHKYYHSAPALGYCELDELKLANNASGLTQRAADKWDSPRFLRGFKASAGFRFRCLSASRPLAANANRYDNTKLDRE